jgi:Thiol-activated cytolysin
MKAIYFLVFFAISTVSITYGQNGNRKQKKQQQITADSTSKETAFQKNGRQRKKNPNAATANTKLDDLKNPFDTTKVATKVPQQKGAMENGRRRKKGNNNTGDDKVLAKNDADMPNLKMEKTDMKIRPDLVKITRTYKSKNGNVDISFEKDKMAKDGIRTKSKSTNEAKCFTKEEVRGQRVENEIKIADGSLATDILPGAVIDASALLNTGQFKFINGKNRKAITLTLSTHKADKKKAIVQPKPNVSIEADLRVKTQELTSPSNIDGMPNMNSSSEMSIATLKETIGLNTASSFFYLGIKANDKFNFSSEKYHYMYMYTFEQVCLSVKADGITAPDDIFTVPTALDNNLLYVKEVKYGRRVNVLVESTTDLMSTSYAAGGQVSLKAVSASLEGEASYSKETKEINIRAYTQGGSPLAITNAAQVEKAIDDYFNKSFRQIDIVPLAYIMTYMDGVKVSQVTNAFLDGNNCLEAEKVRVRIKSIECKKVDDSKKNEELYGSAIIKMYNTQGQVLLVNGAPAPPIVPTGTFSFGSKEVPIILRPTGKKEYDSNEQGKYLDMVIAELDSKFEIIPTVYEKDNGFNKDDEYTTENILKKTLRQMLMEGTTSQSFEFRRKGSVVVVNFEITPL